MTDSRAMLVNWLRDEFAQEQRTGFARLKRVPDTRVIGFLDDFATLSPTGQSELTALLADWSSYKLVGEPVPPTIIEQFTRATCFRHLAEGLRYTGVTMLAGLAKDPSHAGLAGWLEKTGITGLAAQPPENLVSDIDDLVPVKIPTLRRLVKSAFAELFAPTVRDIGSETWFYEGRLGESSLRVVIRYSAKMGRPQLEYQVQVQCKERALTAPNLCFESILGVGFGRWDYLTQNNATRSVELLSELVEYVTKLPERLPV